MNQNLVNRIRSDMESMETSRLLEIWEANDKEQYSEEAFVAIKQLLEARGEKLPPQKEGKEALPISPLKGFGQTKLEVSKGFLYWGAFLAFMSMWPLFNAPLPPGPGLKGGDFGARVLATSSIPMKALGVSGGVISFALCCLWYRLAQMRERRGRLPYIIGGLLFMLGTFFLTFLFWEPGEQEVMHLKLGIGQESLMHLLIKKLLVIILLTLLPAYFLQFKGSIKAPRT